MIPRPSPIRATFRLVLAALGLLAISFLPATRAQSQPRAHLTDVRLPPLCRVDANLSQRAPGQQRAGTIAGSPVEALAAFRTSLSAQGWRAGVVTMLPGPRPMTIQLWRKDGRELLLTLQEVGPGRSRFLLASGVPLASAAPSAKAKKN